ncbi:MAG TPA: GspH/FimT family pseudopilin [Chroococcidiopsis sp.]
MIRRLLNGRLSNGRLPSGQGSEQRSQAGFTLIEVLVVVVMIGILFGIAAPSWIAFMNSRRVNNASDQISQAIRKAQAEAIRTRRSYGVRFDTVSNPPRLIIGRYNETSDTVDTTGAEVEQLGYGSIRPNVITLTPGVSSIVFEANGSVRTEDVTPPVTVPVVFTLTASATGARRCVVLETLLGSVRRIAPGEPGCP